MGDTLYREIGTRAILIDGGMGSTIATLGLTPGDFGGHPGCNEILNRTRPDLIAKVHRQFYEAGSDYVETNSFGGTPIKLDEYGLSADAYKLNKLAAEIARKVADEKSGGGVIGSMGPSGLLPSSPGYDGLPPAEITRAFETQAQGLLDGGADILLIETSQDILEAKSAIVGCRDAMVKCGRQVPLWLSMSLHMDGKMLLGTSIDAALAIAVALDIDAFGINCATGPAEMVDSVRYLSQHCPVPIVVFPNQGLPENIDGEAVFKMTPDEFALQMNEFLKLGVEVVGGCCGTSPAHIQALNDVRENYIQRKIPKRKFMLASAVTSQEIMPEGSPLIIGERLNTLGSRGFKKLLLNDDWNGIIDIAQKQTDLGAQALDLALAVTGRDCEIDDYKILVQRIASEVPLPLMIDSVNPDAVEAALAANPGIGIVNSINLENPDRAEKVLAAIKKYGGAVVCMTIDSNGMAKSVDDKLSVAKQLYDLAVNKYGLPAQAILFDPLTFTLATGDNELRDTVINTLNGITALRTNFPDCGVVLGISNVSYGLTKASRKIINAVFLHHAVKNGLTAAIVNPLDLTDYRDFVGREIELAEDLIFNRRDDALERIIEYTEDIDIDPETPLTANLPIDEQLSIAILDRKESGLENLIDGLLESKTALDIINEILMPAMKEVGDRMERRETILPHVLRSAEVMSRALKYLEKYLESDQSISRKKILLATVFGDVHDIGKNLVKAIVSNNGYDVIDLGKRVPAREIVEAVRREKPIAVGLSALLVATTLEMKNVVEAFHKEGFNVPVIIGGAAVSRGLADSISKIGGETYAGGVFYAKDAFDALNIIRKIAGDKTKPTGTPKAQTMSFTTAKTTSGKNTARVKKPDTPPFYGTQIANFAVGAILSELSEADRRKLTADPEETIRKVKGKLGFVQLINPGAIYGYFKSTKVGLAVTVKHNDDKYIFNFPDKKNTVPNWLEQIDYIIPYVATLGTAAAIVYGKLESSGNISLSAEWAQLCSVLTEITAQTIRRHITNELDLPFDTFVLGVSPGYAMWPDLTDQRKLECLLDWSRLELKLTEHNQIVPEFSTSGLAIIHPDASH